MILISLLSFALTTLSIRLNEISTSHFHLTLFLLFITLEATKKATDYFKQKQYEQHHHRIHVPRSQVEKDSYLDSLTKFGQDDVASSHGEHTHQELSGGTAREYLDTLSEVRKSTWEVYKGQVEKAKEIKHDEVDCKSLYL